MIAYIATPYAYYLKEFGLEFALEMARQRAKEAYDLGYIPLSPILAFNGVYKEDSAEDREKVLSDCNMLMSKCDIFFYREIDLPLSEGMQRELICWKMLNKPIECVKEGENA